MKYYIYYFTAAGKRKNTRELRRAGNKLLSYLDAHKTRYKVAGDAFRPKISKRLAEQGLETIIMFKYSKYYISDMIWGLQACHVGKKGGLF